MFQDFVPLAIAVGGNTEALAKKKAMILEALDTLRDTLSADSAIANVANQQSEAFKRMRAIIDEQ